MRSRNSLAASCLTLILAFAFLPGHSRGADREADLQQALGSQDPLYKFSPGEIAAAVKLCASRDPSHAGAYVVLILRSGRNDADAIAPSLVQAAIEGLGADPESSRIGAIVQAAVTAAPTEVLDIVTAAVKASPRTAAPAIVQAGVSSVPHPESLVTVNVQPRARRAAGSDKEIDGKEAADGKSLGAPTQKQLTLAEAIVQAAVDADPGLSVETLTTTVDEALATVYAGNRPPTLTVVLSPVVPVLPSIAFGNPGPVSP
jgi:hypothetical protein